MHNFTRLFACMAYFLLLSVSHAMDNKQPISDIFIAADVAYKDHDAYLRGLKKHDDEASIFYSKIENFSISLKEEGKYYVIIFTPISVKEFSILGGGVKYKIDKHTYRIVGKIFFQ